MTTETITVAGVKVRLSKFSGTRKWLPAADAAKLIRKQLKERWPEIKFSVRTQHGDSVYVDWTDGPTAKEVEAIGSQYASGRFDGMVDYGWTVEHWLSTKTGAAIVASDQGSARTGGFHEARETEKPEGAEWVQIHSSMKYFSTSRHFSAERMAEVAEAVAKEYGHATAPKVLKTSYGSPYLEESPRVPLCRGSHYSLVDGIYQQLRKTSFV